MSWRKLGYSDHTSAVSTLPFARWAKAPHRRWLAGLSVQETSRVIDDITEEPVGWAGPPPHARWDGSSITDRSPWMSTARREAPFQITPNVFKGLDRVTNIQQLKYVIDKNLVSSESTSQLLLSMSALRLAFLRLQTECSPTSLVIVLNAILKRIRRFKLAPDQPTLYFGLGLAARTGSLQAVKHYLNACDLQYEKKTGSNRGYTAKSLLQTLRFQLREGPDYDRAILGILTGWQNNGVAEPGELRKPSIFELLDGLPPPRWETYLLLLRDHGGKEALYAAWADLHSQGGQQDKQILVEIFVHSFVEINEPEKAWQVVLESGLRAEAIGSESWELLLASPQHLTPAVPNIFASVMEEVERQLLTIESEFRIQWTGGENGMHRSLPPVPEDFDAE